MTTIKNGKYFWYKPIYYQGMKEVCIRYEKIEISKKEYLERNSGQKTS